MAVTKKTKIQIPTDLQVWLKRTAQNTGIKKSLLEEKMIDAYVLKIPQAFDWFEREELQQNHPIDSTVPRVIA